MIDHAARSSPLPAPITADEVAATLAFLSALPDDRPGERLGAIERLGMVKLIADPRRRIGSMPSDRRRAIQRPA